MRHWLIRRRLAAAVVAVIAGSATLAACAPAETPTVTARTQPPLATHAVGTASAGGERLFDGLVEAVRQATLVAQTAGRVAEVRRDADDPVKAGEVILRLAGIEQRARLAQAEQGLVEATARAVDARSEYERMTAIFAKGLVAKSALDRALAERDAAEARLAAARAGVAAAREEAAYTELRAPYAGVVTRRYVEVGEAVQPGQPLAAVAAPDALRVTLEVPQSVAAALRAGPKASVYTGATRFDGGRITVFPSATAGSNTVRVRVELPRAAAGLYPGMFAKVGFGIGGAAPLMVPTSAVVHRSEVAAVYVVAADGLPVFRQVRLGRRSGDQIEVLAGVNPGEQVALDPVEALERLVSQRQGD